MWCVSLSSACFNFQVIPSVLAPELRSRSCAAESAASVIALEEARAAVRHNKQACAGFSLKEENNRTLYQPAEQDIAVLIYNTRRHFIFLPVFALPRQTLVRLNSAAFRPRRVTIICGRRFHVVRARRRVAGAAAPGAKQPTVLLARLAALAGA